MGFDRTLVTKSAGETYKAGQALGATLKRDCLFLCLSGELGSGKTTFVQGFARGLGITARLLSPTFIIVRRYLIPPGSLFFYHIDLYRVNTQRDVSGLGIADILSDPHACVAIEWPEKLGSLMPKKRIDVQLRVLEDGDHELVIKNIA